MYAKIQNGLVVKYPYLLSDLQSEYPGASVPLVWNPAFMESEGLVHVVVTGGPALNPNTHALQEETPEYAPDRARWEQVWSVRPLSDDELTQRRQQLQAQTVTATQARLDDFARTRNYDGILSAATYATSSSAQFSAEGQYAVQARDATWAALYTILADVQAGTRPMPAGYADIEAELPVLAWP